MKSKIEEFNTKSHIEDTIAQTIKLLKNKRIKIKSIKNFKLYTKFRFSIFNFEKRESLFKKIISFWDIFVYVILLIVFTVYLFFILSVYLSTDVKYKSNFSRKIDLLPKWFLAKWLSYNGFTDLTREECAFVLPDFTNTVTRPLDDCGMCRNLSEIKRVKKINKKEFIEKYAYSGIPVIITDSINDWPGLRTFNFDFFRELYLNLEKKKFKKTRTMEHKNSSENLERSSSFIESEIQVDSKLTCQFFSYKSKFKNLIQVFEMKRTKDGTWQMPWYVGWSNCNNHASKILRNHYKRPYFLPTESEMSRIDWIFMGTPGYGASIHIDDVTNPTWQAQISGIKIWTFKPPVECLLKCSLSITAQVKPGEIIIFDSNRWFHSTLITGKELSIAICSEYD